MRYTVWVKFNPSGKIQVSGNEITICLRSKPERGKANKELVEKLASYFEVTKDSVRIISGLTSTKKLLKRNAFVIFRNQHNKEKASGRCW